MVQLLEGMGSLREIAPKLVSASINNKIPRANKLQTSWNNDNRLRDSFNYLSVITPGLIFIFVFIFVFIFI